MSRKHQRRPTYNQSHSSDEIAEHSSPVPGRQRRARSEDSSYSGETSNPTFTRDFADDNFLLRGRRVSQHNFDDDDDEGFDRIFSFNISSNVDHDIPASKQRRTANFRCIGLCISIIVVIILLALSGINTTWTLNAGETRRIETPILSRQITVKAMRSTSRLPLNAVVYSLASCPPLTGPPLVVRDSRVFHLSPEEYQYDYFYLNTGSSISMNSTQKQGSTTLYILEGKNALRRLQSPGPEDDPFGIDSVEEASITEGENATVSYTVKQSDVYTLVYDNPSATNPSDLSTQYDVVMTTYDLKKYDPQCNKLSESQPCIVRRPDKGSCLLIQADKNRNPTSTQAVTVKIHSNRRWFPILIFSIIPYLFGWLAAIYFKPKSVYYAVERREEQQQHDATEMEASPNRRDSEGGSSSSSTSNQVAVETRIV
jgi:hypothetical protein